MIDTILNAVFSFIINLVNLLLSPIDTLIETFLPDLSQALASVSSFLNVAFSSIGWCISALGIPSTAISFIVMYYGVKLTAPILFYVVKLCISWYNKLKA